MSTVRARGPRLVGPPELAGLLAVCALGVAVVVALTATGDPVPADFRPAPVPSSEDCPDAPADGVVSSAELLACPDVYDDAEVVVEGEVVGAVLRREGGAWLQVNDDAYALALGPLPVSGVRAGANTSIAAFVPESVADGIRSAGGADRVGDRLRLTGTYRSADPGDAGAPALRATTAELLLPGRPIERRAGPGRVAAAAVSAAVAGVLVLAARRAGRR